MKSDKHVGDTILEGEFLLFTWGEHSSYGVDGLYRAKQTFVMPGKQRPDDKVGALMPDLARVAADPALVEEVSFVEVWADTA